MMKVESDTIVAIASPPGVGGLAVIRISGHGAFACADAVFRGSEKLSDVLSHTVHFGTVTDDKGIIDELLAAVFRGPRSFTGEDTVEFTCHGSEYIQKAILNILIEKGARLAQPGEFSMRAFMNRKLDLAQAEAIGDLIAADTEAAHRLALNQMRGGFSKEIGRLREKLIDFASLLELELDFSEEDVEFADRKQLIAVIEQTLLKTRKLSDSFQAGNVIKNGVPVAIAGKPNTGKSTLLNLILNEERAIVSDIAGTTRDTIEEEITLGGIKYRFIDTAGIRETTDVIEQLGVGRSHDKIKQARVIIYLFDPGETSSYELNSTLHAIGESKGDEPFLLIPVGNKSDKYNHDYLSSEYKDVPGVIFISAKHHSGINELFDQITGYMNLDKAGQQDIILTNARHKEALDHTSVALTAALDGLKSGLATDLVAIEIRSALMYLGSISGEITTNDLLENIFSKFCIGK